MQGVCNAAWKLADIIDLLIGSPTGWGPDNKVFTSFLEQDGSGEKEDMGEDDVVE